MSTFWLRVAVALYAAGLAHALLVVLNRSSRLFNVALGVFSVGVVLHGVSLVEESVAAGHLPLDNAFQTLSMCAFLIAGLYLFVYWRYDLGSLAVFVYPLVFLMALVGAMELPVGGWTSPRVREVWLVVHILLVLSGYAALLMAAGASILYLMQERRLKQKQKLGFLERLPPLGVLDTFLTRAIGFAFVFITLSVVAGVTWAFIESGTRWLGETRVGISLFTWGFYLVMVFLRTSAGWRGRKAAVLVLGVVCCSAITWATHMGLRTLLAQ